MAALLGASCKRIDESAIQPGSLPVMTTSSGIEMVLIPGGRFEMGSEDGDDDEAPVHPVRLGAFFMDRFEVTQEHYERLMDENDSKVKGPRHPVEMVTWVLAALYCNARSLREGLEPCYDVETAKCDPARNGYRLPTEAEWEYACRASTRTEYSFGNNERALREHAWYAGNSSKTTHPVGQKRPNPWGLYDMHGNVAEWTNDIYEKDYYRKSPSDNPRGPEEGKQYVVRGGSWKAGPEVLRSAHRVAENPGFSDACLAPDTLGFRCVRNASEEAQRDAEESEK
jgi:formylglycine-generating enzyme required for sulfatase activity